MELLWDFDVKLGSTYKIHQGLKVSPFKAVSLLITGINKEDLFSHIV
jgi:hypothetical protein